MCVVSRCILLFQHRLVFSILTPNSAFCFPKMCQLCKLLTPLTIPSHPPFFPYLPQVGVATRNPVPRFSPELRHSGLFPHSRTLQQMLLTKVINGERASYHAPKFLRLTNRSRAQLLLELTESLTEYAMASKQGRATRKINRRANWLPIGASR